MLRRSAFTLIELLVVIGIIAVLAVIVVLTINPAELLKQARDSNRLAQLNSLNKAISLFTIDFPTASLGNGSTTYVSLPDPTITTPGATSTCSSLTLPPLPAGWTYQCVSTTTLRNLDATGWIPISFASSSAGSPLSSLPIDPINTAASGLYYAYVPGGSFVITAPLESTKYTKQNAATDGGTDPARIELGTDLALWGDALGLIGYWKFDEGNGGTAADASGNGNTGTFGGSGGGLPVWATGKVGGAVQFSDSQGVSGRLEWVNIPNSPTLFATSTITIAAWINMSTVVTGSDQAIYSDYQGGTMPTSTYSFEIGANRDSLVFYTNHYSGTYSGNERRTGFLSNIPVGQWVHVVFAWNGGVGGDNITVYLDGVQLAVNSLSGITPGRSSNDFRIGMRRGTGNYFRGMIDDVRVYRRALSAGEISFLYNSTR